MTRKPNTWSTIYQKWLRKGHDHGSAAMKADLWQKRRDQGKPRMWAAMVSWDYEGSDCYGVFTTKRRCENYLKTVKSGDSREAVEFIVNEGTH